MTASKVEIKKDKISMSSNLEKSEGMVLEIQRMSTEDGPGIRTTVFMKGCSLSCTWCHNPESILFKQQLYWVETNCLGCGICVEKCPENALSLNNAEVIINREKCNECGICTKECPSGALEIIGSKWSVDNLVNEILKDRAYFEKSSGGITISGGEPGLQVDFVSSLLKRLKSEGINTAFDTCGMYSEESLKKILPFTNIVLFDLKEIDPLKHKEYTGGTNQLILSNLKFISNYIKENIYPETLWVRTPIIPDATATEENISGIGKFLSNNSIRFDRWELCAFNNLCNNKYERLGFQWTFKEYGLFGNDEMEKLLITAKKTSIRPDNIFWTGSVKKENKKISTKKTNINIIDFCKITAIPNNQE